MSIITLDIEIIFAIRHSIQRRISNVFHRSLALGRMDDIYIKIATGKTTEFLTIVDMEAIVRFYAMSIIVSFIEIVHIIPLDRETKNAINFAASLLYIFTNLRISNIASVSPREIVIPLEHRLAFGIDGSNQRAKICGQSILKISLNRNSIRKNLLNEFFNANGSHAREILGLIRSFRGQCFKGISWSIHRGPSITISKQDICNLDVIQRSITTTQRIQITHIRNIFLRLFKHSLGENGLRTLVVCGSNNSFVGPHSTIQITAARDIKQQSADRRI